jgi:lipopolysaccharide/colanic/teichoic acid biosynthesis glycosyltransferase
MENFMSTRKLTADAIPTDRLFAGSYVPVSVVLCKRSFDIIGAVLLLVATAPLWPLIALAIKINSRGPVVYKQLRVGRALVDRTELFMILKFRSMRQDAELATGAVWASKRDPRITAVGYFLRKTRLDEIPQLFNVLRGDMSLIGPRPERPSFYARLERVAPFFADRTMGLRPGITGFAQVRQGYDSCDADVIRKLGFDSAYALHLSSFRIWLASDISIGLRTLTVMVTGRGQ